MTRSVIAASVAVSASGSGLAGIPLAPWEHQTQCLDIVDGVRRKGIHRALVVMASGLGKTVTVGFDVKNYLRRRPDARFLCLCDQNYILKQNRKTIHAIMGGDARSFGYYHGGRKEKTPQFLFASFQGMAKGYRKFHRDEFDYIVVDESHHTHAATYLPVVKYFRPDFLLGITATPDRHDLKDIREVFGYEVFTLALPEALARGYLAPVDYRLLADSIVELGKIDNPFRISMEELNKRIFVPRRDEEIVRIIQEKCADIADPRIIVFCNSIAHADRFTKHLPGAWAVHSRLPLRVQEHRIQAMRDGEVRALVTVDKFNEGIDIPSANVLVFLRATQSDTIFYQQLGRGLRRDIGKDKVLVLDFVGNCDRLDKVLELQKGIRMEWDRASIHVASGAPTTRILPFGGFEFSEQVRDILALLRKREAGFTKEVLIAMLQSEEKLLGHTPTQRDIERSSKAGRTASIHVFARVFGSFPNALLAAKLKTRRPLMLNVSRQEAISMLRAEAKRLGRPLVSDDIVAASKAGRTPLSCRMHKAIRQLR